jgi:4-amino-4-deoxy-L-arabinose transferase-like glycosyltransferase
VVNSELRIEAPTAEAVHPDESGKVSVNSRVTTYNSPVSRRLILWLLLVAAICPYFVGLGDSSIWDANEAFYVETPREMMERGDYVSPTFNYQPRFNKPVLSYWIVAGFYELFGVSVGVQRVPIAFGALGLILVAFLLARAADSSDAAVWAALGLAIAPRLLMFARRIFIDIYISLFMALTLAFFALAERYPARRRLFLLLMYVSVGLGMLTKGPVAVALPGLVFATYLLLHGELKRVTQMMLPVGTLIVLAIVVPWYAVLYQRYGWTYITSFFIGENVARYTAGVGFQGSRGPFFYVPVVLTDSFPWAVFLFAAAWSWLRDRRATAPEPDPGFRVRTLLWLWIAVIVLFFSFSASKQDLYIFPIVPAIAALAGVFIARALAGAGSRRALHATLGLIGVALALTGVGIVWLFNGGGKAYAIDGEMLVAALGIAGGILALGLSVASRGSAALLTLVVTVVALNWTFVLRVLPSFEVYKPVPRLAAALNPRLTPSDTVATYDVALPSMVYYLRRHVEMLFEPEDLARTFQSANNTVYAVLTRETYRTMAPALGRPTCEIASAPTFDVKLKNILSREPLPELVVITNRCR